MAEVGRRLCHAPPWQGKNESKPTRRVEQFKDRIRQRTCRTLVKRSQNPRIRSLDGRLVCKEEQWKMGKRPRIRLGQERCPLPARPRIPCFFPQHQDQRTPPQDKRSDAIQRYRPEGMGSLWHGKVVCRRWFANLWKRSGQEIRLSGYTRLLWRLRPNGWIQTGSRRKLRRIHPFLYRRGC